MERTIKYGPDKGKTVEVARYSVAVYGSPSQLRTAFIDCDTREGAERVAALESKAGMFVEILDRMED